QPLAFQHVSPYICRLPRPGTSALERGINPQPVASPARPETEAPPLLMTDRETAPSTHDQFTSPTGLRVRADLYDEDYSDAEYEKMLSMYEGTMSQIVEGEIVKSKVLRVTESAVILDVGFKSEGSVPLDEF